MFKSKLLSIILTSLITIISVTIGIYLFLVRDSLEIGYQNLYLLPISYAICYLLFIRVVVKLWNKFIFRSLFNSKFFRYVILSLLVVKSQWF